MIGDLVRKFENKYGSEKNLLPFPSQKDTDPKKKIEKEYLVNYMQSMFSLHMKNRTAIPVNYHSYIQELRDYSSGNQDKSKYLKQMFVLGNSNSSGIDIDEYSGRDSHRTGMTHINKEIVSPAPKLVKMIEGMLQAMEQDIFVNTIDEDSGAKEEEAKNKSFLLAKLMPFIREQEQILALKQQTVESRLPSDISLGELEGYQLAGGFKLNYARVMEKLLKYTQNASNWDDIKIKFASDVVTLNTIFGRCKYDPTTQQDRWQYIDPATAVMQYSRESDFSDSEYGGYFQLMKVSELIDRGLDPFEVKKQAKNFNGYFSNPSDKVWDSKDYENPTGNWYHDWRVPVFHAEWFDTDVKKRLVYDNVYGKRKIIDLEWDAEIKDLSKKQVEKGASQKRQDTCIKKLYQCSWIVGSDIIFDYGVVPNQSRKSKASPELSFKGWRGISTDSRMMFGSIIEQIRPMLDQIQLNWLRLQNAMARATEDMYAVNVRLMSNLKLGGKEIDETELLSMAIRTGILPYADVSYGRKYEGGAVTPISKIEGTSLEGVSRHMAIIQQQISLIHEFLGITPEQVGGASSDIAVTQSQMANMGSNNINRRYISGVFNLKKQLADTSSRRIQLLCKYNETAQKTYARIVGSTDVNILKEAYMLGVEYGTNLEARPEYEEKQELLQMVTAAMQAGREGISQIDFDQGLYIMEQIKGDGNLKELRIKLSFEIRRRRQEREAEQQRNITLQNQQLQQLERAKAQGEMQKRQLDFESNAALENIKAQNEIKLETLKGNIKYEQELLNKSAEYESANREERASKSI